MDCCLVEDHQVLDRKKRQELQGNLSRLEFVAPAFAQYRQAAQERQLDQLLLAVLVLIQNHFQAKPALLLFSLLLFSPGLERLRPLLLILGTCHAICE
jgi:hypothetical protein